MSELNKLSANKSEIDILDLLTLLWKGKKSILKGLGIGTILGLFFAIVSPKEFTVTTTMLPQSESGGGLGKFSSLAAIAGFNLDMDAGSDISPVVYPQIVESEDFMLEILNSKYTFKGIDHPVTMMEYYSKFNRPGIVGTMIKYTLGLPGVIIDAVRGKKPQIKSTRKPGELLQLSKDEDKLIYALKKQITLSINKKEGYLTLTCKFHEALLTAQVAKRAQELLQKRITQYKVQKSTDQLHFIEQRYQEKKANYENLQKRLAGAQDRNLNLFFSSASTEQDRLETEYNIATSVYTELAKQLEQSKIQVKNDTPVFAIIKPVVVPLLKTKPARFTILFMWMLVGIVLGSIYVVSKDPFKKIKALLENPNKLA